MASRLVALLLMLDGNKHKLTPANEGRAGREGCPPSRQVYPFGAVSLPSQIGVGAAVADIGRAAAVTVRTLFLCPDAIDREGGRIRIDGVDCVAPRRRLKESPLGFQLREVGVNPGRGI